MMACAWGAGRASWLEGRKKKFREAGVSSRMWRAKGRVEGRCESREAGIVAGYFEGGMVW